MWGLAKAQPSLGKWVLHGCFGVSWGRGHGEIGGDGDKTVVDDGKDRARLKIQFYLQLAVPHASLSFPSVHVMVLQDDL